MERPDGVDRIPRRALAYWRTRWLLARLPRGLPTLLIGAWLGVLRPVDHHAVGRLWYGSQLDEYGSDEYLTSGLLPWERTAIEEHFPATGRVLVAAAGAGREMIALHRLGFSVAGFECHPGLRRRAIAALRAMDIDATVVPALPDACPPLPDRGDALIVGWSAYMMIPGRARRIAFLRELGGRAAGPGTPVLLSFWPRTGPPARAQASTWVASTLRRARRAEPAELGDGLEPYFVHRFTQDEIEAEIRAAGLALERCSVEAGWAVARVV